MVPTAYLLELITTFLVGHLLIPMTDREIFGYLLTDRKLQGLREGSVCVLFVALHTTLTAYDGL